MWYSSIIFELIGDVFQKREFFDDGFAG